MNISMSYYSDQGGRDYNEDTISALENKDNVLAIVADGLGGCGHGDVASGLAVRQINHQLTGQPVNADRMTEAVNAANKVIRDNQNGNGMKTTVAALWLDEYAVCAAHVGDSRIYQFRNNEIVFQSQDHSVSQMAVLVGEIEKSQIRGHRDRNKLIRALGAGEEVRTDVNQLFWQPGDAFLLCSDGFWELVTEEEMLAALQYTSSANEWLLGMRRYVEKRVHQGSDNHSAIAVRLL